MLGRVSLNRMLLSVCVFLLVAVITVPKSGDYASNTSAVFGRGASQFLADLRRPQCMQHNFGKVNAQLLRLIHVTVHILA